MKYVKQLASKMFYYKLQQNVNETIKIISTSKNNKFRLIKTPGSL
jgi:hypothetical protein